MTHSVNILAQRSSGVLLPVFSLPSPGGIGDLGPGARRFVDFLEASGQSWWQFLPLGPTAADLGESPYMSPSALAGNPLLISPELLAEDGLLPPDRVACPDASEYGVHYDRVRAHKAETLALAWEAFQRRGRMDELEAFMKERPWAREYGLFLALKEAHRQAAWFQWAEPLRRRDKTALAAARKTFAAEIRRHCFAQYLFHRQLSDLKEYAAARGVRLIGDLPIYVAMDSVDVWQSQEIFDLDAATGEARHVAGVPPDYFSATGQRWGNPLYNWNSPKKALRKRLFDWWEQRLRRNFELADALRLDHFRCFEAYWSIPADEETAVNGEWLPGPGLAFFGEMEHRLGRLPIIAEDLGVITPEVEHLRKSFDLPGMKILLFAFDGNPDNSYLPYNCEAASVIYTGTHDNETAVGWYLNPEVPREAKERARRFARSGDDNPGSFHTDLIYLAMSAASKLAVFPMQDLLGFGNDCRMNTPGQGRGNWRWRCAPQYLNEGLAGWLRDLTGFFGRLPRPQPENEANDAEETNNADVDPAP